MQWAQRRACRSRPCRSSLQHRSWINRGQRMGVCVFQAALNTHTYTSAHTQPRADSTGIIRNIWDHLPKGTQALMGSRCTTGFQQKYRNPYLWGAITGCVCVCVCALLHCLLSPHTKYIKCLGMDHPYSGQTRFNNFCFWQKWMSFLLFFF